MPTSSASSATSSSRGQFHIAIDCGNGVAGMLAPRLYRRLGCEVTELYCEVDGTFPNHHPDPAQPKNLVELIKTLKTGKAELGLAFDGDGDRLGVVTKDGEIIFADRQLMLLAKDVLSRNPGAEIIYDVKSTRLLAPYIERHGGKPLLWKTGHSLIKAKLKETGALLAGEMSGHTFFKERWYGFDDALYGGARLLEVLSKEPDANAALKNLPNAPSTPELHWRWKKASRTPWWPSCRREWKPPRRSPAPSAWSPSTACAWSMLTASGSPAPPTPRRSS